MNYRNILFIGLGGHSGKIVRKIKKRLSAYNESHNLHYLLLDLERLHTFGYNDISEDEFIFFGGTNPSQYVQEILREGVESDNYKNLNTYFPIEYPDFKNSLPNRIVEKGAGRKRMLGRLMMYSRRQEVETRLQDVRLKIDSKHDFSTPAVVVVSSCCGGTGSSVFYDILSYFADSNIDVYPVVLGPSMLVAKNNRINKELADKIKMNAMAFFEELYCHMKFPENKMSFFSRNSDFNLQRVIFFDNMISYTATIAGQDMKAFERYVANSLALMFSGEYKSEDMQGLWASIENITEDMLNQPKEIQGKDLQDLWEVKNFISAGYTRNSSAKVYESDLLRVLFENTPTDKFLTKEELLCIVDPQRKSFEELKTHFQMTKNNPDNIYNKYIKPFVYANGILPAALDNQKKLLTPAVVYDYLKEVSNALAEVKEPIQGNTSNLGGRKAGAAPPKEGGWDSFLRKIGWKG